MEYFSDDKFINTASSQTNTALALSLWDASNILSGAFHTQTAVTSLVDFQSELNKGNQQSEAAMPYKQQVSIISSVTSARVITTTATTYLHSRQDGHITANDHTHRITMLTHNKANRRQQTLPPGAQFSSAIWRVTVNNSLCRRIHARICISPLCENKTSSAKTAHTQCTQCSASSSEEDQVTATRVTRTGNFVKFGRLIFEIGERKDKKLTDKHNTSHFLGQSNYEIIAHTVLHMDCHGLTSADEQTLVVITKQHSTLLHNHRPHSSDTKYMLMMNDDDKLLSITVQSQVSNWSWHITNRESAITESTLLGHQI